MCPHRMRKWYSDINCHRTTLARHAPTTGTGRYSLKPFSPHAKRAQPITVLPVSKKYTSERTAAYPDLLIRYLVAKIQMAVYRAPPFLLSALRPDVFTVADKTKRRAPPTMEDTQSKLKRCRFRFTEQIIWTEPLRGTTPLTEKEIANNLAIGGLRNTADSVSRLHVVRDFGAKLGAALMQLITKNSAEHS